MQVSASRAGIRWLSVRVKRIYTCMQARLATGHTFSTVMTINVTVMDDAAHADVTMIMQLRASSARPDSCLANGEQLTEAFLSYMSATAATPIAPSVIACT